MIDQTIEHLLKQVSLINHKHKEIAKITGANFNIFSVLRMQSDEVRLHSRFIGELLNPNGRHEQGAIFLTLFIKTIKALDIQEYQEYQLLNTKIIVEEYIGEISKDFLKGGSIDIVIKPENGKKIIIENKINAGDQPNQIIRYKQHYPNEHLFYLTLYGKEPTEISTGKSLIKDEDFVCISYKEDIIKWLESCLKETVNFPLLRETIIQYINTIKALTGQAMNNQMSNEIVETIINDAENIESAFILSNLDKVKLGLAKKLEEQIKQVADDLHLSVRFFLKQFDNIYEGFMLFHPDLDKDNLAIVFQFLQPMSKNFMYGIMLSKYDVTIKGKKENRNFNNISETITANNFIENNLDTIKKIAGLDLSGPVSIAYTSFQGIENWNGKEFGEIANGKMKNRIEEKIKMLIAAFKQLDKESYQFKFIE